MHLPIPAGAPYVKFLVRHEGGGEEEISIPVTAETFAQPLEALLGLKDGRRHAVKLLEAPPEQRYQGE